MPLANKGMQFCSITVAKGTVTSNMPQMFCNISSPRRKKSTTPGILPQTTISAPEKVSPRRTNNMTELLTAL